MAEEKTSVFQSTVIWFGAAVSIAEILTGVCVAPLGFAKGLAAVLIGHLIGGVFMFLAGLIGGQTGLCAMDTAALSFGKRGAAVFSVLNILQLVGWTAVMTLSGAQAAQALLPLPGTWCWCLIIGALIALWILLGRKSADKINTLAVAALFILSLVLSFFVFRAKTHPAAPGSEISFGAAVELSAAMPLSWLPLISDYTCAAKRPFAASLAGCAVYFAVSSWMFLIGLGAAVLTGAESIPEILSLAGLGAAGLLTVVLSTVTTTYLDVFSAGISCRSLSRRANEKLAALAVCLLGTLLAIADPSSGFENFLYLIGSVFAPMTAIMISDRFVLKRKTPYSFDTTNFVFWLIGVVLYRLYMRLDLPFGCTLPVMVMLSVLVILYNRLLRGEENAR